MCGIMGYFSELLLHFVIVHTDRGRTRTSNLCPVFFQEYAAVTTMLCLSTRWRLLSCRSLVMYATRLYGPVGGGGGGGLKQGRRTGVAMLEAPHSLHPHLSHHPAQPPTTYPVYSGRPETHRGVPFHPHYHPQSTHLAPPSLLPHYQNHAHFHAYGGGAAAGAAATAGGKKKTWNFIHEKMSYDTFFTMKRLIERSRHAEEVLRWITQNPSKISHNHYPVALQKIGQLLQAAPPRGGSESAEAEPGDGGARRVLEHEDFQTLCDAIVNDCAKFDNFSIVNCLYAAAALGESSHQSSAGVCDVPQYSQDPRWDGPWFRL